jgi:hypothetical protein
MTKPEVWQRGPVDGIAPLLQPVAHALIQVGEDVRELLYDFPTELLWIKPFGVASVGFHLQHLSRVLDRLFTYARGEALSDGQLAALKAEGMPDSTLTTHDLIQQYHACLNNALQQLRNTREEELLQFRGIGRKQLPSNVLGLLFHAAEHLQRHLGQVLVTSKCIRINTFNGEQ